MNITRRLNPLLTRGFAFAYGKQGGKILCSPEGSHFPTENKEAKSSAHQRVRILLRKTRRIYV